MCRAAKAGRAGGLFWHWVWRRFSAVDLTDRAWHVTRRLPPAPDSADLSLRVIPRPLPAPDSTGLSSVRDVTVLCRMGEARHVRHAKSAAQRAQPITITPHHPPSRPAGLPAHTRHCGETLYKSLHNVHDPGLCLRPDANAVRVLNHQSNQCLGNNSHPPPPAAATHRLTVSQTCEGMHASYLRSRAACAAAIRRHHTRPSALNPIRKNSWRLTS